jgi:hypothetical protein
MVGLRIRSGEGEFPSRAFVIRILAGVFELPLDD